MGGDLGGLTFVPLSRAGQDYVFTLKPREHVLLPWGHQQGAEVLQRPALVLARAQAGRRSWEKHGIRKKTGPTPGFVLCSAACISFLFLF